LKVAFDRNGSHVWRLGNFRENFLGFATPNYKPAGFHLPLTKQEIYPDSTSAPMTEKLSISPCSSCRSAHEIDKNLCVTLSRQKDIVLEI